MSSVDRPSEDGNGRSVHDGQAQCEAASAAAAEGIRPSGKGAHQEGAEESGNYPIPDRGHAISAKRHSRAERKAGNLTKDEFDRINRKADKMLKKKKSKKPAAKKPAAKKQKAK